MEEKDKQHTEYTKKDVLSKEALSADIKKAKDFLNMYFGFLKDKNISSKLIILLAAISLGLAGYFSFVLYSSWQNLRTKEPELINLTQYDTNSFANNALTKDILSSSTTLYDLLVKDDEIKQNVEKYKNYLRDLQIPYDNFLKYIYLPSLNIWRNVYIKKVDTDMIGLKFLTKNPYDDVALVQKWSDFFKNVGDNNEFNTISNIAVEDILERPDGLFSLPITVSFVANSKRSFLMLVDKLSMTSNKTNVSLINEFFYYLWQEIKKQKQSDIANIVTAYTPLLGSGLSEDTYIGYSLYNRIFSDEGDVSLSAPIRLVDENVLDATIKNLMMCTTIDESQCYYQFRDKYRDVSTFAYAISKDINVDVVNNFKKFFKYFPPLLTIKNFTFDKVKSTDLTTFKNLQYQGTVTIDVYGKGISQEEVDQVASVLGNLCFKEEKTLSLSVALDVITTSITKLSDVVSTDKSKIDDLWELKAVLEDTVTTYDALSNYKKIIKLFETWRMLEDNSLCE